MKYSMTKLSRLAAIRIRKDEEDLIRKKLEALEELLSRLDSVEVPKEAFVLAPEGYHEREDVPVQFESDEVLKTFNSVKDRYVKGPRTL